MSIMSLADLLCRLAGKVVKQGTASSSALRVSADWPGGCTDWPGVCRDAGRGWRLRGMFFLFSYAVMGEYRCNNIYCGLWGRVR